MTQTQSLTEQYTRAADAAVVIRPKREDDEERLVELWNDLNPEFPPQTLERFRYYEDPANQREGAIRERYVAERDGRVVAGLFLRSNAWSQQPGGFAADIGVDQDHQGRGIGRALYDLMLPRLADLRADRILAYVRDDRPSALRFVETRGFERTGHGGRESRLNVHGANLAGFEGTEEQLAASGLRTARVADLDYENEEFRRALYQVDCESARDIPMAEAFSPTPYDLWCRRLFKDPGVRPEWCWVALDGERPIGMAFLQRLGENAAFNDYTGVLPAYRGRGVARALKLRTIEWARENGVDWIYTSNDIENARMLSINVSMGYEPLPTEIEFIKRLR